MRMRFPAIVLCSAVGLAAASVPALAADLSALGRPAATGDGSCDSEGWRFRLTPYAWAISASGDATLRGRDISIDASFTDTLKAADTLVALEGYGEARNGCMGVFADLTYVKTAISKGGPLVGLDATNVITIAQGGALVEVLRGVGFDGTPGGFTVDAMVGVRNVSQNLDLNVSLVPFLPLEKGYSFTDAIVGLRARYLLAPQWELQAWGNVGAGGSNYSWEAGAGIGYRFTLAGYDLTSFIGYRGLGYDLSGNGSNGIQQTLYGPVLGLGGRF